MQTKKKLSIDCVNRVKLEKVQEFPESIFSDVYWNAHMQTERIMAQNDARGEDLEAEKFCIGNEISNVIAFVGERGMGKSSAMLSYAYFLKKYPSNIQGWNNESFWFTKNGEKLINLSFYVLSKVDVAILTNESLFDVVLARMWTAFSDKTDDKNGNDANFNRTAESFNLVKRAYTLYYKDEKQNKNLTSVKQLQELSRSLALREEFANLVSSFLECMLVDTRIGGKNRYLVIPIDDLDLASEKTMAILEQLRIFLSVPQVIILTTVDIEKLLLCGNKKFSDELMCRDIMDESEKNLIRQYSNQYIAKVLPRNSRINMPKYGGESASKYVLDYKKYVAEFVGEKGEAWEKNDVDYLSYVNIMMSKYLNLLMGYRDGLNFEGESLRNIVNKLNELRMICHHGTDYLKSSVLQWLEKEIMISQKQIEKKGNISLWKKLSAASSYDYNEYILADFKSKQSSENIGGGAGYGQVLATILEMRNKEHEKRDMIRLLVLFYSLQIIKCMDERDEKTLNDFFTRNDILSSFMFRRTRFRFMGVRRIDNLLQMDLWYEEKTETADSILKKNAQQIVDVFKILLFCEIENIIGKVKLEFNSDGRVKEIPGADHSEVEVDLPEDIRNKTSFEEDRILRIEISPVVSRVSFDNFFANIINYDKLFKKYINWIYKQLRSLRSEQHKESEKNFEALYEEVLSVSRNGVREMQKWKKKYAIKGIYDIFPVQDVGVMLGVMEKIKNSGHMWFDIDQMMQGFSNAFVEEFREAENNCLYVELGYQRYSDKLEDLLRWIKLDDVSGNIKGRLAVMGRRMEDTTKVG